MQNHTPILSPIYLTIETEKQKNVFTLLDRNGKELKNANWLDVWLTYKRHKVITNEINLKVIKYYYA